MVYERELRERLVFAFRDEFVAIEPTSKAFFSATHFSPLLSPQSRPFMEEHHSFCGLDMMRHFTSAVPRHDGID
ncbi:MAG: hypothetical protein ACKOEO_05125 [Planctomycetaceae bacterium]